MMAADKSIKNMAELASLFTDKIDKIRGEYAKLHDAVIKEGIIDYTAIDAIFKDGAYVDRQQIGILHDSGAEELRSYVRNMFFANIVNNVWIKQGAYIYSRKMSEKNCEFLLLFL